MEFAVQDLSIKKVINSDVIHEGNIHTTLKKEKGKSTIKTHGNIKHKEKNQNYTVSVDGASMDAGEVVYFVTITMNNRKQLKYKMKYRDLFALLNK